MSDIRVACYKKRHGEFPHFMAVTTLRYRVIIYHSPPVWPCNGTEVELLNVLNLILQYRVNTDTDERKVDKWHLSFT